ncbi:MAG: hypothetical protein IIA65_02640 [Planctomycetes bacterium]|nr:hypothetical protein [Planctomycetota bacterium]
MLDSIAHRGPDAVGKYQSELNGMHVLLGHRRLSIIDLSEAANQPFVKNGLVLIFNGEIYNYRELREELRAKRHRFATATDTEVIVHLYEDMGDRCVEKLSGMFAFALWDSRRNRLLLGRDRMGQKPLFYADVEGDFVFVNRRPMG